MNAENAAMTPAAENAVVETATESIGTRFTKKVLAQFASNTGSQIAVTEFQRRLIQGYFIQIDRALASMGCDCAILGCTELSVFRSYHSLPPFYVDAMEVLAELAVVRCGKQLRTI